MSSASASASASANGPSASSTTATLKPASADSSTTASTSPAALGGAAVAVQGEDFQRYLEKSGVIDALTKGQHNYHYQPARQPASKPVNQRVDQHLISEQLILCTYSPPLPRRVSLSKPGPPVLFVSVLVGLYESSEKPSNAIESVQQHIHNTTQHNTTQHNTTQITTPLISAQLTEHCRASQPSV